MQPKRITTKQLTCSCGESFTWSGFGIKPKRCQKCEYARLSEKKKESVKRSQERNSANKKLLSQAYFDHKNCTSKYQSLFKKSKTKTGRKKPVKWKDKDLAAMVQHVQNKFCNPYIRARDIACYGKCISCNSSITQAGHRYCVGDFPGMRFMINNIHGQEVSCNHYKSGNIDAFDRGLNGRHGEAYTEALKRESLIYIRSGHKWLRSDVIAIGETYNYLLKNEIWIFTQEEFNNERDNIN
jgi:hypothetical protein